MAIVGIDLGTTNSAVATIWMNRPEIIPNRYGNRTTPSVVGLTKHNKILVGNKAKYQRVSLIQDPIEEIKRKMDLQGYTLPLGKKQYSPKEISAYILKTLKMESQWFLGTTIDSSVITIPAYFTEAARRATREAGEMAGLQVKMILDEPTAAALAYGITGDKEETVLVYDLGGGTFDISIIEIDGNHFEVLAIEGDPYLGGKDFDRILMEYVFYKIKEKYKIDLTKYPETHSKISVAVEATKCDLSTIKDSSVIIEALMDDIDINIDIKQELLEELLKPIIQKTIPPLERALKRADLEKDEIDHILLVGGSTRMPLVRKTVSDYFNKQARWDLNPDECVAMGAALYTQLIQPNSQKTYSVQNDRISDHEFVVIPRTAHSLGIGVDEGGSHYSIILPANSFYPVSITKKDYFTAIDNQAGIELWVYEGENIIATKNTPLGKIVLDLPKGLPAGIPIWITFSLNDSRILEVMVSLPSKPDVHIKVTIDTQQKIDREEDKQSESIISPAKHQINEIKKLLKQYKNMISQSRYTQIQWAIQNAEDALDNNDENLEKKLHPLNHLHQELLKLEKK